MPLYEITQSGLQPIPTSSFEAKQLRERQDLQRLLKQDIGVISDDLLVIAEEFGDWDDSSRRIDLLAVDCDANLVVIELKRTSDGGHMELQAIRYAAMVSAMTFAQACEAFAKYLQDNRIDRNAQEELLGFLGWEEPNEEDFGRDVQIVLASADFSKEITTAVIWLNQRGLDIKCFKLGLHDFDGRTIVDIQQVIPLPEAESFQVRVKEKVSAARSARAQKTPWNMPRLVASIREKADAAAEQVARDLLDWVKNSADRIWWSDAKVDGSFIPVWEAHHQDRVLFAVRSTGHIEFYFGHLKHRKPFDQDFLRESLATKLRELGADIPADRIGGYPKFPMALLAKPEKLEQFQKIIEWLLEQIKDAGEQAS